MEYRKFEKIKTEAKMFVLSSAHTFELLDLADIKMQTIHLSDIAYALSNKCRFSGQIRQFYSVAEHSVYVSDMVANDLKLIALLHDAVEAYTPDIIRPVKEHVKIFNRRFSEYEDEFLRIIVLKLTGTDILRLSDSDRDQIKHADNLILNKEIDCFYRKNKTDIELLNPNAARKKFVKRFFELYENGKHLQNYLDDGDSFLDSTVNWL